MADYSKYFPDSGDTKDYSRYFPEEGQPDTAPTPEVAQKIIGKSSPISSGPAALWGRVLNRDFPAPPPYDRSRQWGSGIGNAAYEIGGKVTDLTGSPAAGYVANVTAQSIPALFGGKYAQTEFAPALRSGAESLMQSALKPTIKQLKTGQAATAASTLLDQGINATRGGVEVIKDRIGTLNDQIAKAISGSPATVDPVAVAARAQGVTGRFANQVNPSSDLAAIKNSIDEFLATHPNALSVQEAQALKQGTYGQLAKKYGELGSAQTEAQKALARGLKEEVGAAVPEVLGLNKQESDLIKALNVTERRALMNANKNPMGLALLANNPVTWAAFMADRSALFKSLLARMVNAGQQRIPQALGTGAGASLGILSGQPPIVDNSQQRAGGGPVSAGKPYVVGESGPEVFVPQSSGMIVPNALSAPVPRDPAYEYGNMLPFRKPIAGGPAEWSPMYSNAVKSLVDAFTAPKRAWEGTATPEDAVNFGLTVLGTNAAVGPIVGKGIGPGTLAMNPQTKKWLAGSKVKSEVYHGSDATLSKIDPEMARWQTPQSMPGTAWFSADPKVAEGYGSAIYPSYLSLKNPLVVKRHISVKESGTGKWGIGVWEEGTGSGYWWGNEYTSKRAANEALTEARDNGSLNINAAGMRQAVEKAKKSGNDGVIFHGIDDSLGPDNKVSTIYTVFNSDQIKTSIGAK